MLGVRLSFRDTTAPCLSNVYAKPSRDFLRVYHRLIIPIRLQAGTHDGCAALLACLLGTDLHAFWNQTSCFMIESVTPPMLAEPSTEITFGPFWALKKFTAAMVPVVVS